MRTTYAAEETQETKSKEDGKSKETASNCLRASDNPNCTCLEFDRQFDG